MGIFKTSNFFIMNDDEVAIVTLFIPVFIEEHVLKGNRTIRTLDDSDPPIRTLSLDNSDPTFRTIRTPVKDNSDPIF